MGTILLVPGRIVAPRITGTVSGVNRWFSGVLPSLNTTGTVLVESKPSSLFQAYLNPTDLAMRIIEVGTSINEASLVLSTLVLIYVLGLSSQFGT